MAGATAQKIESGDVTLETFDREFVISRMFDASPDLVWQAWTDPKHMAQWWGPEGFATPICELDARPGGAYRIVLRGPSDLEYPLKGTYREVIKSERLVMTMDCSGHPTEWQDLVKPNRRIGEDNPAGEMLATVTFEDVEGETKLTIHMGFESNTIRNALLRMGMAEGWSQNLERLGEHLARMT